MAPSKHIYLVMDAGNPVAAFTAKHEMNTYLKRRLGIQEPARLHLRWRSRILSGHHDDVERDGRWVSEPARLSLLGAPPAWRWWLGKPTEMAATANAAVVRPSAA